MTSGADKTLPTALPASEIDEPGAVYRLAAGAGVTLGGKALGRGLDLLKQVGMARLLGPEVFGLYAIAWNLLSIMATIVLLGLPSAVSRFASLYWQRDDEAFKGVLLSSVSIAFITSLVASMTLLFAAPWLAATVFKEPQLTAAIRWFSIGVPFITGLRLLATATRVSQRMQYAVYTEEVGQTVLNLVLFLLFYFLGLKLLGAVLSTVLSFAAALLLSIRYLLQIFPELLTVRSKIEVGFVQLMAFSVPAAVSGMFGILVGRLDRVFLGLFRPASEVGIYQASAQLSMLFSTIVLGSFNAILTPMIADLHQRGEMERLEELYRITSKWGFYVCLPLFLIVVFSSREIMQVVFGMEYAAGGLPLVILSAGQLINALTGAVGFLLMMTGRQNRWFIISSVMLVIVVLLNIWLIPSMGMLGAALSTATIVSALYLIGLIQVRTQLKLWPYDRRYVKGLVAIFPTVGALLLLRMMLSTPPLLTLFLTGVISIGVYYVTLYVSGPDEEDRVFLRLVRKRVGI